MILAKIHGGLGNQLFQYACGLALAKKYNTQLYLDISDFEKGKNRNNFTLRNFELDRLKIKAEINNGMRFSHYAYPLSLTTRSKYLVNRFLKIPAYIRISEKDFINLGRILKYYHVYLDGYWQNEKYFNAFRKEIISQFQPANLMGEQNTALLSRIETIKDSVSIHVRRGDYIDNKHYHERYGFCGLEYYNRAISYIEAQLPEASFFIFSDDPEWVKVNVKGRDMVYVDYDNEGWQDLVLMSRCKHNIIANSTFSWWAAWLNENPAKKIIAPEEWYADVKLNEERNDLVPKSWVRM